MELEDELGVGEAVGGGSVGEGRRAQVARRGSIARRKTKRRIFVLVQNSRMSAERWIVAEVR